MGNGCCTLTLPHGDILWFSPDSEASLTFQDTTDGYGQGRNRDFMTGACTKKRFNREGNRKGELGGNIIFYRKAQSDTNYQLFSRRPLIEMEKDVKIFAKAFLRCPLGRMPLGLNNIPHHRRDLPGQGQCLLAPCPRAIAIFLEVDGRPQMQEHFCQDSAREAATYYKNSNLEKKPVILHRAIEGSFMTFMLTRDHDQYAFIHLPIIAAIQDCQLDSGYYAKSLVGAFTELFSSLSPGKHRLELSLNMIYDHCEFNYFPFALNINARGLWYSNLDNMALDGPHTEPQKYISTKTPVAIGTCFIKIPPHYSQMVVGILDQKPPIWKYKGNDSGAIVAEAKTVSFGRFYPYLPNGMIGPPDAITLTTPIEEKRLNHEETGYRYRYEFIEFVALWKNKGQPNDESEGLMFEGCMARGEIYPRSFHKSWTWIARRRHGKDVIPEPFPIKNKYINAFAEILKIHLDKEAKANKEAKDA